MTKLKILILEDDSSEGQRLKEGLEALGYKVVGIAGELAYALGLFYSLSPDLVMINIYLNGKPLGLDFAGKINLNPATKRPFIFISRSTDRGIFEQALKSSPDNYLIKPFHPCQAQYAIELALERHYGGSTAFCAQNQHALCTGESVFVKRGDELHKVNAANIYHVEVDGKYSELITDEVKYIVQWPLKTVVDKLNPKLFVRVHRNYAVNLEKIAKINLRDGHVIMQNNYEIPVSHSFRKNLTRKLEILK